MLVTAIAHFSVVFYLDSLSATGSQVPAMVREWPRNSAITTSPAVTLTS
jgi:hypothetical protein